METSYIHGTAPEEQRRLTALNDIINQGSLRELRLAPGDRVLDLGSGLAQLTRSMAKVVGPNGHVIGIEKSSDQIAEALRQMDEAGIRHRPELRAGDATEPPLHDDEWGTFDIAHARFLLEHLTDPLAAVRQMVRAVRSGGRIVLEDDDHGILRLWPEPEGFVQLWSAYIHTYRMIGCDPFVGCHLVELLHNAGATPVRNTWLFFGGCSGSEHFLPLVRNMIGILEGARETIIATGTIDAEAFVDAIASLREWSTRPDAAFWFAISWAEGVKL